MLDAELIFCGLSRNNFESLKKNIEFILLYKKKSQFKNITIFVVDSNSDDGSKEFLDELSQLNNFVKVLHEDELNSIDSRVERIKVCRNLCLKFINQNFKQKPLVYIPCDMDFYLFSKTSFHQLDLLVSRVIKKNAKLAIFPASEPFSSESATYSRPNRIFHRVFVRVHVFSHISIHVLHISTKEEIDFLVKNKGVCTFEITPQHLHLHAPDCYERLGSFSQMNPPVREMEHQKRLWQAVANDEVAIIGSDHALIRLMKKNSPTQKAPLASLEPKLFFL